MLPLLDGDRFAGRVEAAADMKNGVLQVKNVWLEGGVKKTGALEKKIRQCMQRLARFNGCKEVCYAEEKV